MLGGVRDLRLSELPPPTSPSSRLQAVRFFWQGTETIRDLVSLDANQIQLLSEQQADAVNRLAAKVLGEPLEAERLATLAK